MWERFTIPLISLDSSRIQQICVPRFPRTRQRSPYYDKGDHLRDTLKRDAPIWRSPYWDIIVIDDDPECRRPCRQTAVARNVPSLPSSDLPHALAHDGRARSFASLMNMLDSFTLPDPGSATRDVEHLYVRRFQRRTADGRGQAASRSAKVTQEKCMATAAEEEAFD